MILLTIILAYIANVFLNRWIYFQLQKLDNCFYPNPGAIVACFVSLYGTLALLIIYFMYWVETKNESTNTSRTEFFKYKNKQ
jgi:hypothetical protein